MMRQTAAISLSLLLAACGGGGASVEPTETSNPATGNPTTPTTPSQPSNPSNPSSPSNPSTPSPSSATVTTPGTSFSPNIVTIAPGGSVTWQITGATHNVTFGSVKPTGGDIGDTSAGSSVSRAFPNTGTYDYQCTRHSGMAGRVVVSASGSAPANPSNPSTNEGTVVVVTSSAFSPERVEIGVGSVITWDIAAGAGGIVFEEEAPPGGNIPESAQAQRVSRTFSAEGDYDYVNSRNPDVKGRIRVR